MIPIVTFLAFQGEFNKLERFSMVSELDLLSL